MEKLVVSLETAKWLNWSLGSTVSYWRAYEDSGTRRLYTGKYIFVDSDNVYDYAAPTAQEIADELPDKVELRKTSERYLATWVDKEGYQLNYVGETIVEALALLWLEIQKEQRDAR